MDSKTGSAIAVINRLTREALADRDLNETEMSLGQLVVHRRNLRQDVLVVKRRIATVGTDEQVLEAFESLGKARAHYDVMMARTGSELHDHLGQSQPRGRVFNRRPSAPDTVDGAEVVNFIRFPEGSSRKTSRGCSDLPAAPDDLEQSAHQVYKDAFDRQVDFFVARELETSVSDFLLGQICQAHERALEQLERTLDAREKTEQFTHALPEMQSGVKNVTDLIKVRTQAVLSYAQSLAPGMQADLTAFADWAKDEVGCRLAFADIVERGFVAMDAYGRTTEDHMFGKPWQEAKEDPLLKPALAKALGVHSIEGPTLALAL